MPQLDILEPPSSLCRGDLRGQCQRWPEGYGGLQISCRCAPTAHRTLFHVTHQAASKAPTITPVILELGGWAVESRQKGPYSSVLVPSSDALCS